jgi:hypothetical protein
MNRSLRRLIIGILLLALVALLSVLFVHPTLLFWDRLMLYLG